MKRQAKFETAVNRLIKFGPDMAEADRNALAAVIVGEFEDLIPTYKGVKSDAVSRLFEYAARKTEVVPTVEEEPAVVEAVVPAVVEVVAEEEVPVEEPEVVVEPVVEEVVEEQKAPAKPKAPRKPRAKKTAE